MQNVKIHLFASSIFFKLLGVLRRLKDRQRVFKGLSFSRSYSTVLLRSLVEAIKTNQLGGRFSALVSSLVCL